MHVGARGCILRFVVEVSRSRVLVADSRGADRHLRVTWHADTSTIVFSHWARGLCRASTPVAPADSVEVVNLLVKALGEMASRPAAAKSSGAPGLDLLRLLRDRLRPRLAEVIDATTRFLPGRAKLE